MGRVACKFNSINGPNTGVRTRYGTSNSYTSAGYLLKKNCPGGIFYVESTDGGVNNYFKLIDPDSYPGITSNGKTVYVFLSSQFLEYPRPDQVVELGRTTHGGGGGTFGTTTGSSSLTNGVVSNNNNLNYGVVNSSNISGVTDFLNNTKASTMVAENTRVFGSPFQFSNIADNRPFKNDSDVSGYGRKYLENIVAESPIIYITPGVPNYMPGVPATDKNRLATFISQKSSDSNVNSSEIANAINDIEGRYYDFVPAYAEYMRYVNLLCRTCARYMGLCSPDATGKKPEVPGFPGKHYDDFDWGRWTNINYSIEEKQKQGIFEKIGGAFLDPVGTVTDTFNSVINGITDDLFGEYKFLKCYVDPSVSFSESSNNSTTSSMVSGLFDTVEQIVREANFLTSGGDILTTMKETTQDFLGGITGLGSGDANSGINKLFGNATHVISGSNIIIPELWGDSNYDKSYSFTVDLVSPYGDIESCYLNVIVPMMHLIAISMPRQTSANSFGSPFLVKMFAKGWFSCDLGIVSSIRIEKQADSWNIHGIPNHVKVEISVTDLYQSLSISKTSTPKLFFANQGLIEFLAVTSGLNITQGNLGLKIDTIIQTYTNTLKDLFPNMYDSIVQSIRNSIEGWFKITR